MAYLAATFMFGNLIQSGAALKLLQGCPVKPGPRHPYRLRYTGQLNADIRLCVLTSFFGHPLNSSSKPFMGHLLAQFPSFLMMPIIEALRHGRPRALGFPLALGLIYQNFGAALIFPLYWIIFVLAGGPLSLQGPASIIPQDLAEGALAGLLAGYILPTAVMFSTANPYVIAVWQLFPLWIWLIQFIWLAIRPFILGPASPSGYKVVQAIYVLNFLASAISHLTIVLSNLYHPAVLGDFFFPPISASRPSANALLAVGATQFLQWDGLIVK